VLVAIPPGLVCLLDGSAVTCPTTQLQNYTTLPCRTIAANLAAMANTCQALKGYRP
jgi:hypothetical protein